MPDDTKEDRQAEAERKNHLDELLDEALLGTFPASDPLAISIEQPPLRKRKSDRKPRE